jgi:hypothetical protein
LFVTGNFAFEFFAPFQILHSPDEDVPAFHTNQNIGFTLIADPLKKTFNLQMAGFRWLLDGGNSRVDDNPR